VNTAHKILPLHVVHPGNTTESETFDLYMIERVLTEFLADVVPFLARYYMRQELCHPRIRSWKPMIGFSRWEQKCFEFAGVVAALIKFYYDIDSTPLLVDSRVVFDYANKKCSNTTAKHVVLLARIDSFYVYINPLSHKWTMPVLEDTKLVPSEFLIKDGFIDDPWALSYTLCFRLLSRSLLSDLGSSPEEVCGVDAIESLFDVLTPIHTGYEMLTVDERGEASLVSIVNMQPRSTWSVFKWNSFLGTANPHFYPRFENLVADGAPELPENNFSPAMIRLIIGHPWRKFSLEQ